MFPSRPPVPTGPGGACKFTVVETCDRIKEEFTCMQQQNHSLQLEREKLISERSDIQRICVMYYEMANGLNLEMHRQMEIAKRLSAILTQVLPFLSQEHQSQVLSAVERAKQVTMQELNSVLAAQIEDVKSSKFFNGNSMGLPLEQFEAYKLSVMGGANHGVSGLHGSNMSSGHSAGNTSSSTPGSLQSASINAQTSGLLPSLSPSGNPSVSAALLNGLMSAAGASVGPGALMLQSSSSRISPLGREAEKLMTNEEKQRAATAAAAAAAAGSFLLSSRSSGNGPCLVPPPPNPITGLLGSCGEFPGFPGAFPLSAGVGGTDTGRSLSSVPPISQQPCRSSSTDDTGGRQNNSSGVQLGSSNFAGLPHSGLSALTNPLLLPPPTTPTTPGGNSAHSNSNPTGGSVVDEKRRKLNDSKESGHENGNWRTNDDMRSVSERGSNPSGGGRRSGSNRQPLNLSPQLGSGHSSTYPTTSSAPAVGSGSVNSGRSSQTSEVSSLTRWKQSSKNTQSGPGAYSFIVLPNGQTRPCALASAPGATTAQGLPRRLQHLASLPHGDVVCAVTLGPCPVGRASSLAASDLGSRNAGSDTDSVNIGSPGSNAAVSIPSHFAYTGARGSVKLWDLASISASSANAPLANRDISPLATFDCLCYDSYVRSIKLFPDVTGLIVGGESNALTVWDLNGPGRRKAELTFEAPACYALALSLDGKLAYSCCSDGQVAVWDVHNQSIVHQFHGHVDGTSCVEITPDGNRLWTGGLDHKVRCWDIRGNPVTDSSDGSRKTLLIVS
ncbi:unnamed protein product [Trichobilharzia szidati]|nr:unnamed protein product [Trichobilharzia szidati]